MPLPIYLLAVAVFAMATSEFMLAGLIPAIAADLHVPVASAGLLTSAFAAGMVIGAPLMAAMARTWPRRSALVWFLLMFLSAHIVGALTESYAVLAAMRIVSALANAGFLAVALTAATDLVSPDWKGRALAVLLAGTTLATIVGVPAGAWVGELLGWRATFWVVAVLCVPAVIGVALGIPSAPPGESTEGANSLCREFGQLRRYPLLFMMILAAMVNAATFGSFTYLAPVVTDVAGMSSSWVGVVLVLFGAGSFVGVTAAGRFSDRRPYAVLAVGGPLLLFTWVALAVFSASRAAVLSLGFAVGALSFAVGSTLIARILYEAAGAPTMAGAYATVALNVGATVGPIIAGATLSTSLGATGPVWVSCVLVAVALTMAPLIRSMTARTPSRR